MDAIRLLKRTVRLGSGEQALLTFDGDLLYIDVTGASVSMEDLNLALENARKRRLGKGSD